MNKSCVAADMSLLTLQDFEEQSKGRLPLPHNEFLRNGAGREQTLRDNVAAFARLLLRPRVLRDVSNVRLTTRCLGHELRLPFGVAPTAMHALAHPDAERATAAACKEAGCLFILSNMSTVSMEQVAAAAPQSVKWFQLYLNKNHDVSARHVKRAQAAGFSAIVLTIDLPVLGVRLGERRTSFSLPSHMSLANYEEEDVKAIGAHRFGHEQRWRRVTESFDDAMTWDTVSWLRSLTPLPILVKGVLTAEDAREAVARGVAAVIVSNHGARQLDSCPATIDALPEVVRAVAGRVPVLVDGGVRNGSDILKCLALGATAAFIGRPALWGLVAGGRQGVRDTLAILEKELREAMALSGVSSIQQIDKSLVTHISTQCKL